MRRFLGRPEMRQRAAVVLLLVLTGHIAASPAIEAHGLAGSRAVPMENPIEPPLAQIGVASHYGIWHHGRRTASGERFDERKLTAAHPTLPLGTQIRVTNIENGRAVKVRINDRGPYVKGRILDLSTRAAKELGIGKKGLAEVRIEILYDGYGS
jgi:rare lipoprotein A